MKIYFELFQIFFKIGAFTLGGGYAMIPLIQNEIVDKKKWIEKEEFISLLALAQSAPGVLAVNMAVFVGFKVKRYTGMFVTVLGAVLPAFLIIWLLAALFRNFQDNIYVIKAFKAIRPMVAALIGASVYTIGKQAGINRITVFIVLIIAVSVAYLKFPPIFIIISGTIAGNILGALRKRKV
ncbi:MAG: chromate transporter [Leptotrichiaceae bacterium]|nr:chromate transporter [Leptotrichiaceae bacterium]